MEGAKPVAQQYRYELLTWPEINEAVKLKKVVIIPTGAVEQHGHHLPLDVDCRLSPAVCLEAARRSPREILVMPPVSYGYCHHVMDFPGTINIQPSTFINFVLDITRSVAYHGFKRIVIVNGHGSNHPLVEQVGRQTNLQTDALCATMSWWQLIAEDWNKGLRTSDIPGGCAHACELETSMYLHLNGEHVRKDRIRGNIATYQTLPGGEKWNYVDLTAGSGPVTINEWTSTYTETGGIGQPEQATPEKGAAVFEKAVSELIDFVRFFRNRADLPRVDHHETPPTFKLPFAF